MHRLDVFVSVVAPLQDDVGLVDGFVDEVIEVLRAHYANYELVLVDDGSSDGTSARVEAALQRHTGIRLLRLSRRFGVEAAISAGLDGVIGDYVVVMMPESDPVDVIPAMLERAAAGAGVVFGVCHDRSEQSWMIRSGARFFYALAPRLGLEVTPDATLFRVLSRQAVNAVNRIRDHTRYFRLLTMSVGFHSVPFEYRFKARRAPMRRKTLAQAVQLAVGLLTTQSMVPLRLASLLCLVACVGNLLALSYAVAVYLFLSAVEPGWTTRSLHSAAMFAILFACLAVLTEYVGRLLVGTRDRPLYHLYEERTSSAMIADETRRNVILESKVDETESVQ
jgi:dolichol-phosphate mannosyltransferase